MRKVKINVCSIWPLAQISDDFYYLDIWQCARYFVAALFKELAVSTIIEMWGLESRSGTSRSRSRLEIWARSRSRRLRSRLHHCSSHWFLKFYYLPNIRIALVDLLFKNYLKKLGCGDINKTCYFFPQPSKLCFMQQLNLHWVIHTDKQ